MTKGVRVLAVVVTWNAMPWLRKCLESLLGSTLLPDILVVDNGSADGTADFISSEFPKVRLIPNPKGNSGFGSANNIGLEIALKEGYDFVYLLNQDAYIEPDTIERLVGLSFSSGCDILSPVQNNAKGGTDSNFRRKCGRYFDKADGAQDVVEVPFVMAAHWLVRREVIETVGGFSPAFKQYGEDDNYIDRLHYYGFKCGVAANVAAVHDRAERQTSKDKRMRLKCVSVVVKLSSPLRNFTVQRTLAPFVLIGMAVKNFSILPVLYIPKLIARYSELGRLRKQSMSSLGAFLEDMGK